ncbi:hypothetical protein [Arthrobacter oryzae]|nr:hypothetical protein [Arthrobacter oryzae]MDR6504815.1 hypothetical protein [Arthrobacter oryzae]
MDSSSPRTILDLIRAGASALAGNVADRAYIALAAPQDSLEKAAAEES